MSSYRPIDSKREEFRKYLEKAGAMDALTKVLVMLYDEPEKPADALEYIRKHLGDNRPDDAELNVLKTDLEEARLKIQTLEDEIKLLKERLSQYEPIDDIAEKVGSEEPLPDGEGVSGHVTSVSGHATTASAHPTTVAPGNIASQPSGEADGQEPPPAQ